MKLTMTFEKALDLALQAIEPLREVRILAEQLLHDGFPRAAVLEQFEQARQGLRDQGKEKEEDLLLEVMDFIDGWCSPHMKLGGETANPARST
jgi:hypothetical protein